MRPNKYLERSRDSIRSDFALVGREWDPRIMDQNTKLIGAGVAGALLSMLCCFTPVLVIVLSALGLTAFVAKLDYVLVPVFGASIALMIFALVRQIGRASCRESV